MRAIRATMAGLLLGLIAATTAAAGEVRIVDARATPEAGGTWRFDVTLKHADAGWDHYADKWVVEGPDGTTYAERVLLHPHENEQPFTRSLTGVAVPDGVGQVTIRAHDKVHGWAEEALDVALE